jgi:enoyl-[acyl-carrier protein] reductase III
MSYHDSRTDPQPLPGLKGKVALVLGGTRGVGRAVTQKLVASGAEVTATYARSEADARQLVADLSGAPGALSVVRGDARRGTASLDVLEDVRQRHGRLDILVHSVSSLHPAKALNTRLTDAYLDISTALVPLVTAAGPAADLMTGGSGRIVVVSASVARSVVPGFVGLGMAKSALETLTRYLAVELAPRSITVNAVSAAKLDKGPATTLPEVASRMAARTPAGRLATPHDIADVVGLLCLPEAQWITGQIVVADGGLGLLA